MERSLQCSFGALWLNLLDPDDAKHTDPAGNASAGNAWRILSSSTASSDLHLDILKSRPALV